jgi:hypothetical protein
MSLTTRMGNALAPSNFTEAQHFATMLANSDMVPKDFRGKPGNVMVAMQWGAEIGLGPLQAIQNIAVINGRPSVWGDAAIALARSHPACEYITEGVEGEGEARFGWCETKRRGAPKAERRTFSVADAKKAALWGKQGPWQQYPDRMMQLRARGFLLRDVYADAMRGLITQEEAQDMPVEPMPPARGPTVDAAAAYVRPAAPVQAEPATPLQRLTRDATLVTDPTLDRWVAACKKTMQALAAEGPDALGAWWMSMAPHIENVRSEHDADAAQHVEDEYVEALDAVAQQEVAA